MVNDGQVWVVVWLEFVFHFGARNSFGWSVMVICAVVRVVFGLSWLFLFVIVVGWVVVGVCLCMVGWFILFWVRWFVVFSSIQVVLGIGGGRGVAILW